MPVASVKCCKRRMGSEFLTTNTQVLSNSNVTGEQVNESPTTDYKLILICYVILLAGSVTSLFWTWYPFTDEKAEQNDFLSVLQFHDFFAIKFLTALFPEHNSNTKVTDVHTE